MTLLRMPSWLVTTADWKTTEPALIPFEKLPEERQGAEGGSGQRRERAGIPATSSQVADSFV